MAYPKFKKGDRVRVQAPGNARALDYFFKSAQEHAGRVGTVAAVCTYAQAEPDYDVALDGENYASTLDRPGFEQRDLVLA